ncbi:MAG TPA: tRNA epoxyqueuosine(34) reductase QueG [Anaerolineales bacterium]|nr:tRNA epoxyqueuosine(34) reductase QueG [Anaerolineales bacterium]
MSTIMDPAELTEKVKTEALRLGFDLVGVTGPEPPPHLDVFERWLDAGRHGEMTYLATERSRERREDPKRILPECQSILIVGANCRGGAPRLENGRARIAAYAQGNDYHLVLVDRLQPLVAYIHDLSGLKELQYRVYTDTGPILERELAQRAGIGWIGKNTCLINPKLGSYFLLAEILLGVRLVPDPPFSADHCGSCTRCIQACPTNCILPDRTLDATRCISYLTIEVKGTIPEDLRPSIGDWMFGCDICQEVCPWNVRFSEPTSDPSFQPRPGLMDPRPEEFLGLSSDSWKYGLAQTALVRPRRRGLVRNAAIVAGNQRLPDRVGPLSAVLLDDPDPIVRAHAAWALGRISGPEADATLLLAQASEQDHQVLAEINAALQPKDGGPDNKQ